MSVFFADHVAVAFAGCREGPLPICLLSRVLFAVSPLILLSRRPPSPPQNPSALSCIACFSLAIRYSFGFASVAVAAATFPLPNLVCLSPRFPLRLFGCKRSALLLFFFFNPFHPTTAAFASAALASLPSDSYANKNIARSRGLGHLP